MEIERVNADAVFYFAFTKFVQTRAPLRILIEVVGDTFWKKNVSGVAAIHDPLRHVDPGAGNICLFV
jgi:hypothetical protein